MKEKEALASRSSSSDLRYSYDRTHRCSDNSLHQREGRRLCNPRSQLHNSSSHTYCSHMSSHSDTSKCTSSTNRVDSKAHMRGQPHLPTSTQLSG